MNLERYELKAEESLMIFEFVSHGPKGQISKLIKFSETNLKDVYNLAFGDKDSTSGEINDLSISNNADSDKVLITVVQGVYAFTDHYVEGWVYATGSTKSRTRLYRRGISKYINEIRKDFIIYGMRNNEWETFEIDIDYEAFLVKRKRSKFTL